MATGYTRQAAANISAGLTISAADLNAEYNQIQSAFDGTTGHDHSGGSGLGPKISLTGGVSGILPVANGGSGTSSFTAGSIVFSNGTNLIQDNTNLFWNDGSNYLGLGTNSPVADLHIHTSTATDTAIQITNSATGSASGDGLVVAIDSSGNAYIVQKENLPIIFSTNNTERMRIFNDGNISIGNSVNSFKLSVTGSINATTGYRVAGTALAASHLSNGTTGSGAVMLAASPTSTGTLTAANIHVNVDTFVGGALQVNGAVSANSLTLTTDLAVTDGGTGASTASGAFSNIVKESSNLVADGYIKYIDGLIEQWGTVTIALNSEAVVFPLAFASSVFTVILTPTQQDTVWVTSAGTTGFTANCDSVVGLDVYWRAVGL